MRGRGGGGGSSPFLAAVRAAQGGDTSDGRVAEDDVVMDDSGAAGVGIPLVEVDATGPYAGMEPVQKAKAQAFKVAVFERLSETLLAHAAHVFRRLELHSKWRMSGRRTRATWNSE